jgi:pimeloyl-ACP methyl ester carboxylesterase
MRPSHLALCVALAAGLLGCDAGGTPAVAKADAPAPAQRCAALQDKQLGFGQVTEVEHVTRGEQTVALWKRLLLKVLAPKLKLPDLNAPRDFCRVWGEVRPVPGSLVKVQVWLPDEWNGKMLAKGGGGFNGGMFAASMAMYQGSNLGYATVVTDVGHGMSLTAKFAHESREQFIDFGYRGNHVTAVFTKDLIAAHYGKPAQRAYFQGGSNGGREALMEARRFPEDYDGIVAGAPATSWSRLMTSFAWNAQAVAGTPVAAGLHKKRGLLHGAVLKKCDALDGVTDEVLENPTLCSFDPGELKCTAADGPDCLNGDEVAVLQKIYGGPRLRDGTQVFPGMPLGGEALFENWDYWLVPEDADETGAQGGFALEAFRWMVHGDGEWELSRFDIDRDYPLARERMGPITDSDDPDISEFLQRGGKLLIHHGWADAAITAGSTLNYYDALLKKVGQAAEQQVRLFMVPGMRHGPGGSPAPTVYDTLAEIDRWVEGGAAPETIIATRYDTDDVWEGIATTAKPVRTRPLCAWPKTAHYNGSGSTDDAANFSCK